MRIESHATSVLQYIHLITDVFTIFLIGLLVALWNAVVLLTLVPFVDDVLLFYFQTNKDGRIILLAKCSRKTNTTIVLILQV
jgi:hypothetical protein